MFRESLLESSPGPNKNKRWPMATAFIGELAVAAVLIMIPLFSTGIIPLSARAPKPPLTIVKMAEAEPKPSGDTHATSGPRAPATQVRELDMRRDAIPFPPGRQQQLIGEAIPENLTPCTGNCVANNLPDFGPASLTSTSAIPARVRFSSMLPGQLINRVEPVYPHAATVIHLHGTVQLHAIIAKDGSIQSLQVVSGHPLLAASALDAVRQWRYRPYILNGQPVEVETFITVTFKNAQ
jgi:periplasmic protein TonB